MNRTYFFNFFAVALAIILTALSVNKFGNSNKNDTAFINNFYAKKTNNTLFCVFEYTWGPHNDPNSFMKVPYINNIGGYCPGSFSLCAIVAEEDLFSNPGHPTQASLNYLLTNYGYYYYFPYEVSGLIEFKWEY